MCKIFIDHSLGTRLLTKFWTHKDSCQTALAPWNRQPKGEGEHGKSWPRDSRVLGVVEVLGLLDRVSEPPLRDSFARFDSSLVPP